MRVEIHLAEPATEPRFSVEHPPALAMALRSGSIEVGLHRSTGEMRLSPHHLGKWFRTDDLHVVMLTISDTALVAAAGETSDKVELRSIDTLVDARLGPQPLMPTYLRASPVGGCF